MTAIVPADAFRLSRYGQGIAVDFGRLETDPAGSQTVSVVVGDRIAMSIETAKRLLVWLGDAVAPHAGKMLAEDAKTFAPAAAAVAARPGAVSPRPSPDQAGETAALLMRMIGSWDVPYVYERSARFSADGLQANRFLLTLNTSSIPRDPAARVTAVCERFAMPAALRDAAIPHIAASRCVHFGFEGQPDSIVCKLYLERTVQPPEAQAARDANRPVELYLAFKWDLLRDSAVTTRYLWYPGLSTKEIEARLAGVYRDGHTASFNLAVSLLRQAGERAGAAALQYMEVDERENGRRSFDLNVYKSRLSVKDILGPLQQLSARFPIRPSHFQALYDQIKGMAFGHIAGGIHRNGEDFFNLYYGAASVPPIRDRGFGDVA